MKLLRIAHQLAAAARPASARQRRKEPSSRVRSWRTGVLAGGTVVLVAACGSTVQTTGAATPFGVDPGTELPAGDDGLGPVAGEDGLELGSPEAGEAPPGVAGAQPGVPGGGGAPGTGPAPGQQGAAGGPDAPAGSGGAQAPPPPPASGPGFTAKTINIGVAYNSLLSDQMGQAGAAGGSQALGDQKRQVEAIVKDINGRGGIGGRKIVPVFYNTMGMQFDAHAASQAACTAWTEDNRVFAAMTFVAELGNDNMYSCLSKRQVVFVPWAAEAGATLKRYAPSLWIPGGVAVERAGPVWAQRLNAMKYFTGWDTNQGGPGPLPPKIGLLLGNGVRNGNPAMDEELEKSIRAALSKQGRTVADVFSMKTPDQASAAVLRFKSQGITHVIGDFSIALFTQPAESQEYRPRYGVSSFSGGEALQLFSPPRQLFGTLGVGWAPQGDVDAARDPGDVSPAEGHCRKIMKAAGEPTESRLAWVAMTWACDTFNFFEGAIEGSGFSPAALPHAAAALGPMPPAFTFGISFPRGRPDGVTYARDVAYDPACSCFKYLSKTNHQL